MFAQLSKRFSQLTEKLKSLKIHTPNPFAKQKRNPFFHFKTANIQKAFLSLLLTSSTFELRFPTAASENYSLMFLYKNFSHSAKEGEKKWKANEENLHQTSEKNTRNNPKCYGEKGRGKNAFTWSTRTDKASSGKALSHIVSRFHEISWLPFFFPPRLFCSQIIREKIAWKIKILIGWNDDKEKRKHCK